MWQQRSEVTSSPVFQYEDLAHYDLDGMGGVYGDVRPHPAACSLQTVHLAAGTYAPHQYSQSNHSSSPAGPVGDKDVIYGYDEFRDPVKLKDCSLLPPHLPPDIPCSHCSLSFLENVSWPRARLERVAPEEETSAPPTPSGRTWPSSPHRSKSQTHPEFRILDYFSKNLLKKKKLKGGIAKWSKLADANAKLTSSIFTFFLPQPCSFTRPDQIREADMSLQP